MLPNLLSTVAILLWPATASLVSSLANDDFNIELKQKDAEVYHEQSFGRNEFNYGYQVERTNSQFQHKAKGPDDVTYGCYGYIDPVGEKHLVYYIADRLGYRLLAPDQPTKVFTDRVANSVNKLDADLQGRKLDEKVVAWNDLYLPSTCRRLNEIVSITEPPTPVPVVPVTTARPVFNPIVTQGSKRPHVSPVATTQRPPGGTGGNGNGVFGGDQGKLNFGGDDSGTDHGQPPVLVEESSSAGKTTEVAAPSTELPQESSHNGAGVSEEPNNGSEDTGNGVGNWPNIGVGIVGEPNREGQTGTGDSSKVDIVELPVTTTTVQPPRVVYTPPQTTTTAAPTPSPKQIDPIVFVPDTTHVPVAPTTPRPQSRVPETGAGHPPAAAHHPSCGHESPNGPPFHGAQGPQFPASVGQFNGFVFPINRNCDASGRSTADLLAQMQAINELVLKVSNALHALDGASADRNATCHRVLELLDIQRPVPLLVYVPIMIPYLDGGINTAGAGSSAGAQRPPINPASYAYARSCSECT